MIVFGAVWAVSVYLSLALMCGHWRRAFGDYPNFGVFLIDTLSGPVGLCSSVICWLCWSPKGIDFDWPIRLKRAIDAHRKGRHVEAAHFIAQGNPAQVVLRGGSGPTLSNNLFASGVSYYAGSNAAMRAAMLHAQALRQTPLSVAETMFIPRDAISVGLLRIVQDMRMFPDPAYPNTMGWRQWNFDFENSCLRSPVQHTAWPDPELHCETWDERDVVRGVAGIHAHLVPANWTEFAEGTAAIQVSGIVERFGRFVLGTEGWRAEWTIIRKLHTRSRAVAAALRDIYPDVEIILGGPNANR